MAAGIETRLWGLSGPETRGSRLGRGVGRAGAVSVGTILVLNSASLYLPYRYSGPKIMLEVGAARPGDAEDREIVADTAAPVRIVPFLVRVSVFPAQAEHALFIGLRSVRTDLDRALVQIADPTGTL